MPDISFLSQSDRAKLARTIGVPIGDGRVFRNGTVVSAEDAQRTEMDRARNSLLSQQTSGYRQSQEMLQREQSRMGKPSPQFLAPQAPAQPAQSQPQAPQAPGAPQGAPSPLMLAQANLIQSYQSQQPAPQQNPQPSPGILAAAGPNISSAPTGQPQGSVGFQRADGSYSVQGANGAQQSFGSEQAANTFYQFGANGGVQTPGQPAIAPAPSPAFMPQPQQAQAPAQPTLANKTYSPQEISRMSPEQVLTRDAFDQQNAAKTQQSQQLKAQSGYASQEEALAAGNKAKQPGQAVQVEPTGKGGFTFKVVQESKAPQTNVSVGEGLIGKAYSGYEKSRNDIVAADETLSTLDEAVKEIESGKAFTGTGAQFKLQGAKIAQLLGSEKFNDEIAATEAVVSTIAQAALSQIQRLPGPASDKDIKFIQSAASGSTGGVPGKDTLRKIREIMARTVERNKTRFQQDIDRTFTGDDQNAQFAKRSLSLGSSAKPAQSDQAPGADIESILSKYR